MKSDFFHNGSLKELDQGTALSLAHNSRPAPEGHSVGRWTAGPPYEISELALDE